MSVQAIAWALGTKTGSPTRKAVLLALANRHNSDTGLCCPSISNLAAEAELSKRAVSDQLTELCKAGLIVKVPRTRENGSRTSNQYVICMGVVQELHGGSDPVAPPEPELEPELEPEVDPSPPKASKEEKDAIWEALETVFGKPTTPQHRSRFGRVQKELLADSSLTADLVPSEIQVRSDRYRGKWPDAELTLEALAKHWPDLREGNGNGRMTLSKRLAAMSAEGSA